MYRHIKIIPVYKCTITISTARKDGQHVSIGLAKSLVAPVTSRGLSEVGAHDMPSHVHLLQLFVAISPVAEDKVLLVSGKAMDLTRVFAHIPIPSGCPSS